MKLSFLGCFATHLVGAAAGGALFYFLSATPPPVADTMDAPRHPSSSPSSRSSQSVNLQLTGLLHELENPIPEDDPLFTYSIREWGVHHMANQPKVDRENRAELRRLLALSKAYATIGNLAPLITDTLVADDEDNSRALFLESYRRDPDAAFDALAAREEWFWSFDEIVVLHIPNDTILAQAGRSDRPDEFRTTLLGQLGQKLADADQLAFLDESLATLDQAAGDELIYSFVDSWVPDNGLEAARYIVRSMPPAHRLRLLEALSNGQPNHPHTAWTDDFATALFQQDLDIPRDLMTELTWESERTDNTVANPWRHFAERAPAAIEPGLERDEAFEQLSQILDRQLLRQQDYPELFADGSITADAVAAEMQNQISGSEEYGTELQRALFIKLAPHEPARAITWAQSKIHPRTLGNDAVQLISKLEEPRTERLADLVRLLPAAPSDNPRVEQVSASVLKRFDDWRQLDPGTADTALSRISPTHPIWKFQSHPSVGP